MFSVSSFAQSDCLPLYGGGITDRQFCPKPTVQQQQTNTTSGTKKASPQTKGGLPIHPATQKKQTPDTGPEAIALIGLVPLAAAGFLLRKKA